MNIFVGLIFVLNFRRIKTKNSAMKKTMGTRVGIDEDTYQKVETYMAMVSAFLKLLEVHFLARNYST